MNIKLQKSTEIISLAEITGPIGSKIYHKEQKVDWTVTNVRCTTKENQSASFTLAADILCLAFIFDTAVFIAFMTMTRSPGSNCLESEAWVEEFNTTSRSSSAVILSSSNCLSCSKKIFYLHEVGKKNHVTPNSSSLILASAPFLKVKIKNL